MMLSVLVSQAGKVILSSERGKKKKAKPEVLNRPLRDPTTGPPYNAYVTRRQLADKLIKFRAFMSRASKKKKKKQQQQQQQISKDTYVRNTVGIIRREKTKYVQTLPFSYLPGSTKSIFFFALSA